MAAPGGSFEPGKNSAGKKADISRDAPDLIVRFNGKEFLPSDETTLGSALLGNLSKRAKQGQYAITFQRPYLVDLCVGSGSAFTKTPLSIKGFVLGESPSGSPSVLNLISADGKKVKLPVVLVTEQDGEWRLAKTSLGWNRDLSRDASNQGPTSRHVEFTGDGVFLVVLHPDNEGVVPMPLTVHSIVVNDQGSVLKQNLSMGEYFNLLPSPLI